MEDQNTNIYGKTPASADTIPQTLSTQTSPPRKPLTPFKLIKRVIFTIFGIICLLGVWETFFPTKPPTINTNPSPSITVNQSITWKTYINSKFHYSIRYPDNLDMSQQTPYSTVFQIKNHQQLVFPSLYISVIPDGITSSDNIYNFLSADVINNFFTMPDNQTQLIQPGQDPQYWTYQKLATIPIADKEAIVIQNNNVWQAQNGEVNRRVLLKTNGFTYIIGSYYTNQQGLNYFHDFLFSFKLL